MEITTEALAAQIEAWTNDKNQTLAKLNYLEGAIQSYRVLITQIENGAVQDEAAPEDEQEQTTDAIENSDSDKEEKGSASPAGVDAQNGSGVGHVAADKREAGQDIKAVGNKAKAQTASKSKV